MRGSTFEEETRRHFYGTIGSRNDGYHGNGGDSIVSFVCDNQSIRSKQYT